MVGESKTTSDAAEQEGLHGEPEAFLGYRLWRVRDGHLLSLTNDTVWPRGHALVARSDIGAGQAVIRLAVFVLAVGWLVLLPVSAWSWRVGGRYDHVVARLGLAEAWVTMLAATLTVVAWIIMLLPPCWHLR